MFNRRNFIQTTLATSVGMATANLNAQPMGTELFFDVLNTPQLPANSGKDQPIEIRQFFAYWCPHCAHLEEALNTWVATLPKRVKFTRTPVSFQTAQNGFSLLYYVIESLPNAKALHAKVFEAVHSVHTLKPTASDKDIKNFAIDFLKLDRAKIDSIWNGFSTQSALTRNRQLLNDYKVDGIPLLAIQGKYTTGPAKIAQMVPPGTPKPSMYQTMFSAIDKLIVTL